MKYLKGDIFLGTGLTLVSARPRRSKARSGAAFNAQVGGHQVDLKSPFCSKEVVN
jgi:hypothetical protein